MAHDDRYGERSVEQALARLLAPAAPSNGASAPATASITSPSQYTDWVAQEWHLDDELLLGDEHHCCIAWQLIELLLPVGAVASDETEELRAARFLLNRYPRIPTSFDQYIPDARPPETLRQACDRIGASPRGIPAPDVKANQRQAMAGTVINRPGESKRLFGDRTSWNADGGGTKRAAKGLRHALAQLLIDQDLRRRMIDDLIAIGPPVAAPPVLLDYADIRPPHHPDHHKLRPSCLADLLTVSPRPVRASAQPTNERIHFGAPPGYAGFSVRQALDLQRRAVVLGDPGSGKSTIGLAYAIWMARENRSVVFVHATDLITQIPSGPLSLSTVIECLLVAYRKVIQPREAADQQRDEASLRRRLHEDNDALVVIDGIDEAGEHRDKLDGIVDALERLRGRVLLTSRYVGYQSPRREHWTEYTVDRLSPSSITTFLGYWFGGHATDEYAEARNAVAFLESRDRVAGIVPALLVFVAYVAGFGPVPRGFAGIYERYVTLFVQQEWKPPTSPVSETTTADQITMLTEVAWRMSTTRGVPSPYSWSDTTTIKEVLVDQLDTPVEPLIALIKLRGVLCPSGPDADSLNQEFRWAHRTLHEHLCGSHLAMIARTNTQHFINIVSWCAQHPSIWAVPLQHAYGLIEETDRVALVKTAIELSREGDPGGAILQTLDALSRSLLHPDRASRRIHAYALQKKYWDLALRIDADGTAEGVYQEVLHGNYDVLNFYPQLVERDDLVDRQLLERARRDLPKLLATSDHGAYFAIRLLQGRQPAAEVTRAFTEAVPAMFDPLALLTAIGPLDLTDDEDAIRVLEACARRRPDSAGDYYLIRWLAEHGVTNKAVADSGLFPATALRWARGGPTALDHPWDEDLRAPDRIPELLARLEISQPIAETAIDARLGARLTSLLGLVVPLDMFSVASPLPASLEFGLWIQLLYGQDFGTNDERLARLYAATCPTPLTSDDFDVALDVEPSYEAACQYLRCYGHLYLYGQGEVTAAQYLRLEHAANTLLHAYGGEIERTQNSPVDYLLSDSAHLISNRELRRAILGSPPSMWQDEDHSSLLAALFRLPTLGWDARFIHELFAWNTDLALGILEYNYIAEAAVELFELIAESLDGSELDTTARWSLLRIAGVCLEPAGFLPSWRSRLLSMGVLADT